MKNNLVTNLRNRLIAVLFLCFYGTLLHGQNCNFPAPVITTDFTSQCILYDDKHDPIPDPNLCWKVCENGQVGYHIQPVTGHTYVWTVGGGGILSGQGTTDIEVQWNVAGSGVVQVTQTDATGCSISVEHCITIIPTPEAFFTTQPFNDSQTNQVLQVCSGTTVHFLGHVKQASVQSPIASWYWDFRDPASGNDNTSTDQDDNHIFTLPGSYQVQLTITNQCGCTATAYMIIEVTPDEAVEIQCPTPVCEGASDTYSVNVQCPPQQGGQYLWTISPPSAGVITSNTPYGNTITVHWLDGSNGPGIVSFTGVNCLTNCNAVASMIVPIISSNANIQGSSLICTDNLVAQYSVPAMPGSLFSWSITGGTFVSGQNTNSVIVKWADCTTPPCAGSIGVTYVNSFFECPDGNSIMNITIKPPVTVTGDQTICSGAVATYSINATQQFEWTLLDNTGSVIYGPLVQSAPFIIPANITGTLSPGSYTVQVNDFSGNYCTPTVNYSITVNPTPPSPTALSGEMKPCAGASYLYTCTPFNPTNVLNWTVTGGTPATGNGSTLSISWGTTMPYTISVTEYDPNTGCVSLPINLSPVKKVFIMPDVCALTEDIAGTAVPLSLDCTSPTPVGKSCLNTHKTYKIANWSSYNIDLYEISILPSDIGSVVSATVNANDEMVLEIQWNNTLQLNTIIKFDTYTCGGINPYFTFRLDVKGGAPFTITGPNPACDNVPATFNITPQPAAGTYNYANYTWNWGDFVGSSGQNFPYDPAGIIHVYSIDGSGISTFPITVTLDVDGCLSSASSAVTVNPGPGAYIGSSLFCLSTVPITLTALPAGQNSYQWSTGATTPSITINAAANYTVTITGANGCVDMASIAVPDCPVACPDLIGYTIQFNTPVFNTAFGSVTIGGTISGGPITGYVIDWGDNTTPLIVTTTNTSFSNITHTYEYQGNYNICVTVYNTINGVVHCYSDCVSLNIPVKAYIYSHISCPSAATPGAYNFTFNASVFSTNPINSYQWLFDGGNIGNGPISNTIPVSPTGNHTVSVTVTTSSGYTCTQNNTLNQLLIPTPPGAAFTIAPNPPFCEKQTVVNFNFTGSVTQVHHALWDFGDGASYAPLFPTSVQHIDAQRVYDAFSIPTYHVELKVYDNYGCYYTDDDYVSVYENRLNGFPIPPLNSFCPGASKTLGYYPDVLQGGGNSIIPTDYLWSTGAVTPTLPVHSTGQYYITVFDAASGCKYVSPRFADVSVYNVPNLIVRGKSDYCQGEAVFFDGYSGNGSYEWQPLPGGLMLAPPSTNLQASAIHIAPPATGTYTVTLMLTTADGCSTLVSKTFNVLDPPTVPLVAVQPTPGCENNAVTLTATNWAATLVLNWSQGGNTNPITVPNTGNYNAIFTDPASGCTSQSAIVRVNANPDISWLVSGCLDRCDNDQNHIVIPGSYGISYARWTWIINSQYLNAPYSGYASPVGDLDINNALAGGGTLAPGSYIVQLELVSDMGCKITTDPIYVTVRTCPCKITEVREDWYQCLGTDLNGQSFYHFQFTVHFNNLIPTGTFTLAPNPPGGNTNITPWTYQVNGNDVMIEGILGFYQIDDILPCFTLTYTDPDPSLSCTYTFCVKPPDCPTPKCGWEMEMDEIYCINLDANGNQTYAVNLNVSLPPGNWSAMYSLSSGTLTGFPASTTGGGITALQGIFTDLPPTNGQMCLYVNFYDVMTGDYCFVYKCFNLPDCNGGGTGNTRLTAALKEQHADEPQLTIMPNPASSQALVQFVLPAASGKDLNSVLTLTNARGAVINIRHIMANTGFVRYNTSMLPEGMYYLTISTDGKTVLTQKFSVIK
ncbi:MAG TPA: PKD domain-containing protein [Bacteroidia bacterium]|nr:PKD domain-containing protein [Bacteroidota bacterium]HMW10412.1 PKD domain-containing protein [Bacteroidia bacterium]HNG84713.1 PKD domain-containing protein [Bacteroidia bacterium]